MELLLRAVDITGPSQWRWLLTDAETGVPLADCQVDIDLRSDEAERFADLFGYAWRRSAPDRRVADSARIVAAAGEWAGRELLGESVGIAIANAAFSGQVTVRVACEPPADQVLLWPLELAHCGRMPLAARGDVSFVYDFGGNRPSSPKAPSTGSIRVLAVFSQPTRTGALALRRERYALSRLFRRLAARERLAVELRVVQYGATRERLAAIADDGDGWDVLHLSGHGAGGLFLLEKSDGSRDLVPAADLIRLLRPLRRRIKFALLSACESAARTTAETYRLIGLTDQAAAIETESGGEAASEALGLARALVGELGCAAVGMRYPVTDEFAIAFGELLYEQLLSRRQPVAIAVARAAAGAAGQVPSSTRPAVLLATPAVFGAQAASLRLVAPRSHPLLDPAAQKMAYFPDEPSRFTGRAAEMAQASAALAPGSGRTGIVLHGMAGVGKSACALELAYGHADAFAALAFWQAPARQDEWASALPDLANRLDIQLAWGDGFTMASHIGTTADFDAFMPRLRRLMANSGVLLVLDNMETLLTRNGTWRDPRWEQLVTALLSHDGESRVILTSRVALGGGLGAITGDLIGRGTVGRVVTLPVHSLSLGEAAMLARELPNLRALLHADAGPLRPATINGADRDRAESERRHADADRVRRVLRVVQGHPKLMELADAAAADRGRLDAQLAAAEVAADTAASGSAGAAGRALEEFFRGGSSVLDTEQFLNALTTWTVTSLAALPPAARLAAEFLACLEEEDRQTDIVDVNWDALWRRLERSGDPPDPGPLLEALMAAALIGAHAPSYSAHRTRPTTDGTQQVVMARSQTDGRQTLVYRMHPGVAAAVGAAADPGTREAVDAELADFWQSMAWQGRDRGEGAEDTALIVHAGLAAAPYLLRRGDWDAASTLLDYSASRDGSPRVIQSALPALTYVAKTTGTPKDIGILARVLTTVDRAEAERLLWDTLSRGEIGHDYRVASAAAGELVTLLLGAGRPGEALEMASRQIGYARQGSFGPWTQLMAQAARIQILGVLGEHEQVLTEAGELRAQIRQLSAEPMPGRDSNEIVSPWRVTEFILDVSRYSARALHRWQESLDIAAELLASQQDRGAPDHHTARELLGDVEPLIRLGETDQARRLLHHCQQVFEDHADITMLASALAYSANLEYELGHWHAAADLALTAIRLGYARLSARQIAACHHNLAGFLGKADGDRASQRAHLLAAALLFRLASMTDDMANSQRVLCEQIQQDSAGLRLPATLTEVIEVAERTEGVRLGELITALEPDAKRAEEALAQILVTARELLDDVITSLRQWEPVIAATVAACEAGDDATAELRDGLAEPAMLPKWAPLAAVLRRVLAGERGESLLEGLDPVEYAIIHATLDRLA